MQWWNVVLIALVVSYGLLDVGTLSPNVTRTHDVVRISGCIVECLVPVADLSASTRVGRLGGDAAERVMACVDLALNQSVDLERVAVSMVPCLRAALGISQDRAYGKLVEHSAHFCLLTRGVTLAVDLSSVAWFVFHMCSSVLFAVLVWNLWPASVMQRWKPFAWLVLNLTTRAATAVLAFVSFGDMLALGLHFVRTGWLHGLFGFLAVLVFLAGVAFYRYLPKTLHQEIDIDLQHPDRPAVRHSETRPKWWSLFEEAAPNPRIDRGPLHRRVRTEALFGVQPQFVEPAKSAAVVAQRLDSGDYRHLGVCFRVGDKGISVLHNLLAGGHDPATTDLTNLVVLHNCVSATIGEFHTLGPMKQGRSKGEIIAFKWPTALDQVKSSRLVVSTIPASQLMILTLDRNGRGDRYKLAGANKVSYDKGDYVYHFDTLPGDSGAPLFDESGAVRAIHYGGSGRGNVGIAFVPENFPTLKDYLQTPWGQVADMAEPRGDVRQESHPVVVSIDCCEAQKIAHARSCGCNGESPCTFTDRCSNHNVAAQNGVVPTRDNGVWRQVPESTVAEKPKRNVVIADRRDIVPKEVDVNPESKAPKGKQPADCTLELIQETLQEVLLVQRTQARYLERVRADAEEALELAEEAASQRIQTRGVKNQQKGYKKGPSKDPVEESAASEDEKPRRNVAAIECSFCGKKGHSAQKCFSLKREKAREAAPKQRLEREESTKATTESKKRKPKTPAPTQSDREESEAENSGNGPSLRLKAGGDRSKPRKGKSPERTSQ